MTVTTVGMLPVVIDPDGVDPLDINDGVGWVVGADLKMPPPAAKPQYAASSETEGSIPVPDSEKYENRTIEFTVRVYGDSDTQIEDRLALLYERFGRIHRKGGVLGVATPGGRTIKFDLVGEADADTTFSDMWVKLNKTDVSISLVARPFWRGEEVFVGTATENTLPVLELVSDPIAGDVPALGRLVVTDLSGADQWTVIVGSQSENYSPDDNRALYFQADSLTPLGSSTTPGFGVIANGSLSANRQAILSSRLALTKAHLQHKGSYRVGALVTRPGANQGKVSVQLEWAEGDFKRRTLNPPVQYDYNDREDVVCFANLGTVSISPDADHWEFRLVAYTDWLGDDINIAAVMLFPTDDCYIAMSGRRSENQIPTVFLAQDSFQLGSGALAGDALDSGGVWVGGGADPTDYTTDAANHAALRTEINDANNVLGGRAALVPATSTLTDQAMRVFVQSALAIGGGAATPDQILVRGVTMRYTGTSNGLVAGIYQQASGTSPSVHTLPFVNAYVAIRVAGTDILLVNERLPAWVEPAMNVTGQGITDNLILGVSCQVDASGLVQVTIWPWTGTTFATYYGWHASLATGGALAAGSVGIYDRSSGGSTVNNRRIFFPAAWEPTRDAAMFGWKALELTHERARRKTLDDTWGRVSDPAGRYLRLKPGVNRLLVAALRNDPSLASNANADALQADLWATPRGLMVPPG